LGLLGAAQPALAAPAVSRSRSSIGPALAEKVDEIGKRDLDILAAELRATVERRLPPAPTAGPDLVIDDARPNRPTPQQMMTTQGLSMESFGVGGARISGDYVDPAGRRTPIAYSWYERRHPLGALRLDLARRRGRLRPPGRPSGQGPVQRRRVKRAFRQPCQPPDTASDRCS
jgi:hypothetical protein